MVVIVLEFRIRTYDVLTRLKLLATAVRQVDIADAAHATLSAIAALYAAECPRAKESDTALAESTLTHALAVVGRRVGGLRAAIRIAQQ